MNFASFSTHKVLQVKIPSILLHNQLRYLAAMDISIHCRTLSLWQINFHLSDKFEMLTYIYVSSEIRALYACFLGV